MQIRITRSNASATVCLTAFVCLLYLSGCGSSSSAPSSDTTAPKVSSTIPADADVGVPINRAFTATFNEALDPASITAATFTVTQGGTAVSGAVSYVGTTAIFRPSANLAMSLPFIATITTGAKDLAGNALAANKTWSFTTGTTLDLTAPTILSTAPADTATGVAINRSVTATFDKAMDPSTLTSTTFTLTQGGNAVAGVVSYAGSTTATFKSTANLAISLPFIATITTGAKDLAGNALALSKTWTFTTGAAAGIGPAPVILGTAGNFVILSKAGIDTVPTSAITGDIGISPIDGTAFTHFSEALFGSFATCGQVTGKMYAANYSGTTPSVLTTAVSDMETAYTDAAGRVTPDFTELGAGDISGLTLVPGLYKWGTGLSINTDITLNGGANDVWILQIGQGITQANGTIVHMTGGALPKNVFWQSAGVVSIGTTAHFEGVILSQTSVAMNTGSSINGRLYAQTAVTLKSSTVTQPAP